MAKRKSRRRRESFSKKKFSKFSLKKKFFHQNYRDEKSDFAILLSRYGLGENFPSKLESQAEKIFQNYHQQKKQIFQGRKDLTKQHIITIDGEDAKDFDDAISIEKNSQGFLLGVHIADVSFFIEEKSNLDREAYLRGNSFYLLDRVLPMLPEKISNVLCSLQEGQERLTLSCFIQVDGKGNIIDFSFQRAVIKSNKRWTYSQVEKILKSFFNSSSNDSVNNSSTKKIKKFFHKTEEIAEETIKITQKEKNFFAIAWQLAKILKQKRVAEGSILFQSREFKCHLEKEKIISIEKKQNLHSENLIEEFMLLANQCAAKFLKQNKCNTLYRIHPKPSEKKLLLFKKFVAQQKLSFNETLYKKNNFKNSKNTKEKNKIINKTKNKFQLFLEQNLKENFNQQNLIQEKKQKTLPKNHGDFFSEIYYSLLLNSMSKAEYSVSSSIHYGLGFRDYCHFTSPIRRYPDLVVHRSIIGIIEKKTFQKNSRKQATWLSSRETHAVNCEREYFKLKVLRYLKRNNASKKRTVYIKAIYPDAVFVEDVDCGLYGELKGDFHHYIFDSTRYLDRNDKIIYQLGMVLKVFIQEIDLVGLKIVYRLE